jgi:4-amino-4-deoxy-L-arabinose transferase-like glycosyltransferase
MQPKMLSERLQAPRCNVRSPLRSIVSEVGRLALGALPVAAAAALAIWSLNFGLPYLFRPDEELMVGRSVHIAVEHSLDPLFYNYPPLAFYLFAAAAAVAGLLPGHPLGPASQVDPSAAYLAGRAVSALAFAFCVGFVYAAGRAIDGTVSGFAAAVCLAFAPLAVRQAHFATPDGAATALVAAAVWLGLKAESRRGFLSAGLLCGLAAATKYTSGLVLVFPLVLILFGEDRTGRTAAALAGSVLAFAGVVALAGHPLEYLQGLTFLGERASKGYGDVPIGFVYHPTVSLPYGLGFGAYGLALAGVALALVRRRPVDVALLSFLLASSLVIGFSHEDFWRYVLPMLPALCLLAGGLARPAPATWAWRGIFVAAVLVLQLPSAYASVTTDRLLGAEDTRQQAAEWLLQNAPAGSELRLSSYWGQPFYDQEEFENRPLLPLYVSGNLIVDSYQQGLFTDRFLINRPGSPCFTLVESGPPWQAPVPATTDLPAAVFKPYTGSGPAAARYDPLDSLYLPIWGFDGLQRPGPSTVIVAGCLEARPKRPARDSVARWSSPQGADEERRERMTMRDRAPQEATQRMGRMGAEDPLAFSATPLDSGG